MLLVIDNYDSFTYNLVQYLGELGAEMQVHRNDQLTVQQIRRLKPERIVLSSRPVYAERSGRFGAAGQGAGGEAADPGGLSRPPVDCGSFRG